MPVVLIAVLPPAFVVRLARAPPVAPPTMPLNDGVAVGLGAAGLHDAAVDERRAAGVGGQAGERSAGSVTDRAAERGVGRAVGDQGKAPIHRAVERDVARADAGGQVAV